MARMLRENDSIFDYFNAMATYNAIRGMPKSWAAILNKAEWVLFLNLYSMNYKDCKSSISFIDQAQHIAKYNDLIVMWCGSEDSHIEYPGNLYELRDQIERHTSEEARQDRPTGINVGGSSGRYLSASPNAIYNRSSNTPE